MVRSNNKIVAPLRNNGQKNQTKNKPMKPASKKVYRYMRKCNDLEISGPTRMHRFARACLYAQDNQASPYNTPPDQDNFLVLDNAKGITKLTSGANKELCCIANRIIRSLVSRASMLVNVTKTSKSVTTSSLDLVNNFFTAA